MNTDEFWSMIDTTRQQSNGNLKAQDELLIDALSQLSTEDIQEFDRILWEMMARAYRADVWDAARLVACGCSDDGFHEFRNWLIAQGRVAYERVLEDPENLADIVIVDKGRRFDIDIWGGITSVAGEAYEQKTGREMEIPESGYQEEVDLDRSLTPENELPAKFPRIIAKIGGCDDETLFD